MITKEAESNLPFQPGGTAPKAEIPIYSQPDAEAIADGETEPFEWMDLRDVESAIERLIDADEVVLTVDVATLVLVYPFETAVVRELHAENGIAFTRGELMKRIDETYRKIYELEEESQSSPTPEFADRKPIRNRPRSDGEFGIWGHDYRDLGVSSIEVHEISNKIWLDLAMES